MLEHLQAAIEESGAIITYDTLPIVTAEETQVIQLFQNLIGNAIKFCDNKRPEIHIGVDRKDSQWVFSVRDNGIGFAQEYADQIFLPFKRLHSRDMYTGSGSGTGIGLAICKRIVERHGGNIWAKSEAGSGAIFYFTIPDRGDKESSNQQGRPIEILLVEDNSTDILLTKEALAGAKVLNNLHVVTDGVQAMLFLRKQDQYADRASPDLILLDLNLPIKSGLEVLREIKGDSNFRHIPVVIVTTSKQEQDIVKAYDNGANCYITKPVDFAQFCELIQAIEQFWFTIVTLPPR